MLPRKKQIQFNPVHKTTITPVNKPSIIEGAGTKMPTKKFEQPKILMGGGAGCIEEGRVDTNVERCGFQKDKSGISYKEEVRRLKKKKTPKDPLWNAVQFNIVNPTAASCSFNLFNGYIQQGIPNTPSGYVPASVNPLQFVPSFYPTPSLYPNTECATIDTSISSHFVPLATAYVSSTNRVYVASLFTVSNDILVINPNTNTVVNTIVTSLFNPSQMMVYASVQNAVYFTDVSTSKISVIDCATETEITTIDLSLVGVPSQIAYSAANNFLYVTIASANKMYYIDCSMNIIVGAITLSTNCNALVTWNNGANNYAMVLNASATTGYFINTNSNSVTSIFTIPTLPNVAGAICYNSVKDSVYYIDFTGVVNEISVSSLITTATSVSGFPNSFSLLFVAAFNVIYIDKRSISFSTANVLNCATNNIDLVINTSVSPLLTGSRFSYDNVNNSVWMTGNGLNTIISKLCNNSSATCYITGSYDYTQFLIELGNCSFEVHSIMIVTDTPEAMNNPFEITKRDADGNSSTNPILPNTTISTGQFQQNIGYIEFPNKSLILDNQMIFSSYPIAPNSTVKMILYYRQVCQLEVYTHTETPCTKINDIKCQDGNSKKTSDLKFFARRPHERPKWQKSFKEKMESREKPTIPHIDKIKDCESMYADLGHPIIVNTSLSKKYIPESQLQNAKAIKPIPFQNEVPLCEQACGS